MSRDTIAKLAEGVCKNLKLDCSKMLALFTGPNCCLNSSSINKFLDHGLQSTSTMNVIHLFQMIRTGSIAKFDYGNLLKNIYHYGHLVPPVYDIMAIPNEFPLFVGYGGQDALSEEHDVQLLLNDLRDHDPNKLVVLFTKDYAHVDYFFAVNAKQIIYDPMIAFFSVN
ncbi:hypothetical protein VNO78_22389 [Psophocarpus tetragonolobus]|uniref:Triacylglycerol lipase n=1 Tax=Psophocarpus tetragonolobus TaxID=3891 RepID=A0AAN9SDH3_PSOTE